MRILYFAPTPFEGMKQRPQYLAEGLARVHEVVYVDPTVSIMKYLLRGGETPKGYLRRASERLRLIRLDGRRTAHRSLEAVSTFFCLSEKRQLRPWLNWAELIWIGYSPWYPLVRDFAGPIIYDKMDEDRDITRNPLTKRLIARAEPELIARADTVFVTAQRFYDRLKPSKERVFLVKNAVDALQTVPSATRHGADSGRTFGYVGMISHWFDMEAILLILESAPDCHVVLVGPTEIPRVEHPRLRYTGQVPKSQVGEWIGSFDVCLYPFRKNALLDTIDPVKIYEYLAANKPVLAVDSVETRRFGDLVARYGNARELAEAVKRPMTPPFSDPAALEAFITENSWEARLECIQRVMKL